MRKRSIALLAGAGATVLTFAVGAALPASAAETCATWTMLR